MRPLRACKSFGLFLPKLGRASRGRFFFRPSLDSRRGAVANFIRCKSSRRMRWHDPADDRIARRIASNAARFDATPPRSDRADIMPGLGSGGGIATIIEAPPSLAGLLVLPIVCCHGGGLRPSWSRLGERMDVPGIPLQGRVDIQLGQKRQADRRATRDLPAQKGPSSRGGGCRCRFRYRSGPASRAGYRPARSCSGRAGPTGASTWCRRSPTTRRAAAW